MINVNHMNGISFKNGDNIYYVMDVLGSSYS